MYKLTVYINDANVEPIVVHTSIPAIEKRDIFANGITNEYGVTYSPSVIKRIEKEEICGR